MEKNYLRDELSGMARFGAALATSPKRVSVARRPRDATGVVRALRGELRFFRRPIAGMAFDTFPAVLCRWRDLFRLRDGVKSVDSDSPFVWPAEPDHNTDVEQHGVRDARHRVDGDLRLYHGSVHGVV